MLSPQQYAVLSAVRAQTWRAPGVTCAKLNPPLTPIGTLLAVSENAGSPSCPLPLLPQQYASPPSVTPQDVAPLPAASTWRNRKAVLTATGTVSAPSRIWEALRAEIGRAEAQPTVRGLWRLWRGAVAVAALALVVIAVWAVRPQEPLLPPPTVVAADVDQEFQSTLEGHLSAIWVTPLADEAALGLQMAALGEEG